MSDWAGLWVGLGLAIGFGYGLYGIGEGIASAGDHLYRAVKRLCESLERFDDEEGG